MTVAADRIPNWFAVYTGELASAATVGELEWSIHLPPQPGTDGLSTLVDGS